MGHKCVEALRHLAVLLQKNGAKVRYLERVLSQFQYLLISFYLSIRRLYESSETSKATSSKSITNNNYDCGQLYMHNLCSILLGHFSGHSLVEACKTLCLISL